MAEQEKCEEELDPYTELMVQVKNMKQELEDIKKTNKAKDEIIAQTMKTNKKLLEAPTPVPQNISKRSYEDAMFDSYERRTKMKLK